MTCVDCIDINGRDLRRCATCFNNPQNLDSLNQDAWDCWKLCDKAGRDQFGKIRIEAINSTLAAIDGSKCDINKVLLLEKIANERSPKISDGT